MELKSNIYNLTDLTKALDNINDTSDLSQLLNKIRFNFKDIEHLCFWDNENYSKINIGSGKNYDLFLICWEKQQQSSIHNHEDTIESWSYLLKGKVTENVFERNRNSLNSENFKLLKETVLTNSKTSSLKHIKNLYHSFTNSFNGRSVSLHLYVK